MQEEINNDLNSISADIVPNDSDSAREAVFLFNERRREDALKATIHLITKISVIVVFLVLVIVLIVRVAHFIIPDNFRWLSEVQLQGLDKFFFSGALGGLMSKYAGKIFNSTQAN